MRIVLLLLFTALCVSAAERPNVLVVITDDQGYGDLGAHGNPVLKTPQLDAFAKQSAQLTNFYVCPVCSPTRSALLTGRYNYRTGVVDTYIGRSMMHADEVTLAEMLRDAGYRTGLFGKWHLGDNFPMRPQDQGFQEVLMHKGGGIAQPSDPPGGSSYMNPTLFHNGAAKPYKGYCTDVFTDAALDFIGKKNEQPFFAYVAYNCPHGPYQVQDADHKPYQGTDLSSNAFPKEGQPWAGAKLNQVEISRAYGMIANVDMNFGRLLAKLPTNTLVIFLTDNGPGGVRWNAGLRNRKGTVYEGGIRVPFYVRWDKAFPAGAKNSTPAAHIDITPTVLDVCGVKAPDKLKLDGRSVRPLLTGKVDTWPERYLVSQWHRGDVPEMGRSFAIRGSRYKLVQANGVGEGKYTPKEELFDITNDPFEQNDLAAKEPERVAELRKAYETWFADVKSTRNFAGPRIHVGSAEEKVTDLTRQDWRGPKSGWRPGDEGHWEVTVTRGGTYRVTIDYAAPTVESSLTFKFGAIEMTKKVPAKSTQATFAKVTLAKGDGLVEAWLVGENEKRSGVTYVQLERLGD